MFAETERSERSRRPAAHFGRPGRQQSDDGARVRESPVDVAREAAGLQVEPGGWSPELGRPRRPRRSVHGDVAPESRGSRPTIAEKSPKSRRGNMDLRADGAAKPPRPRLGFHVMGGGDQARPAGGVGEGDSEAHVATATRKPGAISHLKTGRRRRTAARAGRRSLRSASTRRCPGRPECRNSGIAQETTPRVSSPSPPWSPR